MSTSTRGKPARTKPPVSATEIANELLSRVPENGFTREQLRRAVARLLEICPSADVRCLHLTWDADSTYLVVECALEEAAALVGRELLPAPPRRVRYDDLPSWLNQVRRERNSRMRIYATVTDEDRGCPAGAFSPTEIRNLAPDGPQSAQEWREHLRGQLERALNFADPRLIEGAIRRPIHPRARRIGATYFAAIDAANARFGLRDGDVQHLVALYARLHGQTIKAMLAALDSAQVEDRSGKPASSPLRLVVDNTVRP
jgi:hypothetical protein